MIKTTTMLVQELSSYENPNAKIRLLVKQGTLIPIIRGIYETDRNVPGYYLAPIIYGPSYLSFEFALSFHSLIPEAVYNFKSATFEKKKKKRYDTPFGVFLYQDVPSDVYPLGVEIHSKNGYGFMVATPAKAICDTLYTISPLKNIRQLEYLLFDDLRIDQDEFLKIDRQEMVDLASHYHTKNHSLLIKYIRKDNKI